MNTKYYKKYLKYKQKYLNLSLQFGGNEQLQKLYFEKLKELQPTCIQYTNDNDNYKNHKITYGEMEYEGIEILYNKFNKDFELTNFIDIGSGRGKLCLYMALFPHITQSIGIELVTSRHDSALKLQNLLQHEYEDYTKKVDFINSDIFNIELSKVLKNKSKVFVWMSNLCFDHSITDSIFNKLHQELPSDSIICCSKPVTENTNYSLIENISIPMSWDKNSNVYVYKLQS